MNFPDLPTDNLYKFLAIFGLVILFGSNLLSYRLMEELRSKVDRSTSLSKLFSLEVKFIEDDVKTAEDELNVLKKQIKEGQIVKEVADEQMKEKMKEVKNLRERIRQGEKNLAENPPTDPKVFLSEIDFIRFILRDGTFIGYFVSTLGFILWYIKLQRYQDIFIKNEAEKLIKSSSYKKR